MFNMLNLFTRAVGIIAMTGFLLACSNNDDRVESTKAVTSMPLQAFTIPTGGTLRAFIILDGNTGSRIEMTINTTAGTATANIPNLTRTTHDVQIVYEYTEGASTYTLALSSVHTVDLTNGSGSIDIPATDYNMAFDADSDGMNNAAELAAGRNINGLDGNQPCVLGTSQLGSCTI